MRITSRRVTPLAGVLAGLVLATSAVLLSGCSGFFDRYPAADSSADLVGTWVHGSGRLTLNGDGTFEMTDMPTWVSVGKSNGSASPSTISCTGTWEFSSRIDNWWLSSTVPDCGGGGFTTGRQDEMTIAFGIDSGSGDPRCFELVLDGSTLTPRGYDDCLQYN